MEPTPMIRETRTVVYQAGQPSPQDVLKKGQSHPKPESIEMDMAGVPKKDYQFVQQLQSLAGSPNAVDYQIVVLRKSPAILNNYKFACNKILSTYDVGTYHDIRGYVVAEFGGGTYEIRLIKPRGDVLAGAYDKVGSMIFVQDVKSTPPICDAFTTQGLDYKAVSPGFNSLSAGPIPVGGRTPDPETEDIQSLVNLRRKNQLKHEIAEQNSQIADSEERREELRLRRKLEQDREERSAALEWQSRFDTERQKHESSMVSMMANSQRQTTDLITQLVQGGKNDGGIGAMVAAVMTAMSKSQEMQIAMMRSQSEDRRADSQKLAELQAENQRNMVTMLSAMSAKSEALVDKLLTARVESPDQRIEQILKAKEAGKSEAKEWFQMIEEVRASAMQDAGGNDEVEWDPEAGALGNLTALAFRGLQRLLTGPAAGQAMQMVNRLLNKPASNTQFTDSEVAAAAQQMEPYLNAAQPAPRLAAPPVQRTIGFLPGQTTPPPVMQVPAPPVGRPEPGMIYQTTEPQPVLQAPAAKPTMQFVVPQAEILSPEADLPPTYAAEATIEPTETSEDRLRFHVNSMLEDCMADLQDQRHVHQWPFTAFEVLNKPFLDELARTRSEEEQVNLIKRYADPSLFQTWYQIFWRPNGTEQFRKFCAGIQQLIALHHVEQQNHASTIAS